MQLNKYIDHTLLKPNASEDDVRKICEEALKYNFASVCVNPCHVKFVKKMLKDSDVKTCCVIGFPLGANSKESKIFETKNSVKNGADEIDMVINIGYLKSGKEEDVYEEIRDIKKACGKKTLKVIIETCYLSDEEKRKACMLSLKTKADFVKTSTGFGTGGATLEDVKLMKDVVGDNAQIKASGGIRDHETAMKYIELGATRLGTSSGIAIMEGVKSEDGTY